MNIWENLKPLSVESWFVSVYHLPERSTLPASLDCRIKLIEEYQS